MYVKCFFMQRKGVFIHYDTHSTIAGIRIYMVKKPSKMGRIQAKRGKFGFFCCKDLLKIGQNVGKNGFPTCFLYVPYMDKPLIINVDVGNVGMQVEKHFQDGDADVSEESQRNKAKRKISCTSTWMLPRSFASLWMTIKCII